MRPKVDIGDAGSKPQQREAEFLFGGDSCVHSSSDWSMIEYSAVNSDRFDSNPALNAATCLHRC